MLTNLQLEIFDEKTNNRVYQSVSERIWDQIRFPMGEEIIDQIWNTINEQLRYSIKDYMKNAFLLG